MNISITTAANNGHLILYIIDSSGLTILQLRDSDSGLEILVPGHDYRLEWHVWSPSDAEYAIEATVNPDNSGFAPFIFSKQYTGAHRDMGGFYFKSMI